MIVYEFIRVTGLLGLLHYGCKPSEPVNLLSNKTIIPNKTFQDSAYLKRPKVLMVGDSVVTAVVKDELEKDIFDHLVLNHTQV